MASIPSDGNLLPGSVVVLARTIDGRLVRAGEDQREVLRHDTPWGPLIFDRQRMLAQSPLVPGGNIHLSPTLGSVLARLLEDPEAWVSEIELHQIQNPRDTTFTSRDRNTVIVAISRLRFLLGDRPEPHTKRPTKAWQLIFTFRASEQTYYSLTLCPPNNRPVEPKIDRQQYIYQHEIPSVGKLILYADRGIAQSPLKPARDIEIGPVETRLLAVLMSDPERVFSRQVLIREVWRDKSPSPLLDHGADLTACILRLRAKLGDTAPYRIIHSFRQLGCSLSGHKNPSAGA